MRVELHPLIVVELVVPATSSYLLAS